MKNRVIRIGSLGTVIISLLMISSATAINVLQSDTATSMKKNVFIDPNIFLTKDQVSKLQQAVQFIDDSKDKAIVQQIIQTLQVKGKVDSDEIKDIVCKLNIYDRSFYAGFVAAHGGAGSVGGFPPHFLRLLIFSGVVTFGTIIIGSWDVIGGTLNAPSCTINGCVIFNNQPNKGLALLGFGTWGIGYWGGIDCSFSGLFTLIIVSPT